MTIIYMVSKSKLIVLIRRCCWVTRTDSDSMR